MRYVIANVFGSVDCDSFVSYQYFDKVKQMINQYGCMSNRYDVAVSLCWYRVSVST